MADILIADDNPHAHHLAEAALAPAGHRVRAVSDGRAAMRRIEDAKPDLVLLDTKMPLADGAAVCRSIRAKPDLADVRIVMLAGPLDPFDRGEAGAEGFDAVLQKPLDAARLLQTVNDLLGDRSPEAAAAPAADPFTHLVEETLGGKSGRIVEKEIRQAVEEVLTAAMPAIVERIAMRVSRKLREL